MAALEGLLGLWADEELGTSSSDADSDDFAALSADEPGEPGSPPTVRTPRGVLLLHTGNVEGDRRWVLVEEIRARGYDDFASLKCGSNGCVYRVRRTADNAQLVIKLGDVSAEEVATQRRAAAAGVGPLVIDSFPVTIVSYTAATGYRELDRKAVGQFAIVMPLLAPLDDYVLEHGITGDLFVAWTRLYGLKRTQRIYHGDWHWGNTMLQLGAPEYPGGPPLVKRMLLIDWEVFLELERVRPQTLDTLVALDAIYQMSWFTVKEDATTALHNGMLRYMLNATLNNGATTLAMRQSALTFLRATIVGALNNRLALDRARAPVVPGIRQRPRPKAVNVPFDRLLEYFHFKAPAARRIEQSVDAATGLPLYV